MYVPYFLAFFLDASAANEYSQNNWLPSMSRSSQRWKFPDELRILLQDGRRTNGDL